MIKLFDRVKVNTSTTGTGDITFGSAASASFLTPADAGVLDGDGVRYVIIDGLDFEEGVGLIKDTVAKMERTVTKSKIGGTVGTTKINLSGTATVFLSVSAADILTPDDNLASLKNAGTALTNLGGTSVGKSVFTSTAPVGRGALGVDIIGGFRNKIINGDFDIWQRGTTFSTTAYTADRWQLTVGTGATCSVSQSALTLGTLFGKGTPKYCLQWARSVAGTAASFVSQYIESVLTIQGQDATVTFWAKSASDTSLDVSIAQNFGTGGSPSSTVSTAAQTVSLTSTWTKFSLKFAIASISGKTLGSNGDDYLGLRFFRNHNDTNPTTTVSIVHVSLVSGDATNEDDPFSPRHIQQELALCQRYYEQCTSNDTSGALPGCIDASGSATGAGLTLRNQVQFNVEKRVIPTIMGTTRASNAVGALTYGGGTRAVYGQASATGAAVNVYFTAYWTADAEF